MDMQIDKLHTTQLGEERVRLNLSLETEDVVGWCKAVIRTYSADDSRVERRGKNSYVDCVRFVITACLTAQKREGIGISTRRAQF